MGRDQVRTEILLPGFAAALDRWGMTKRSARRVLGIQLAEADFYRVLRSEESTPAEVQEVAKAIYEHGKKYKLPGWEELRCA